MKTIQYTLILFLLASVNAQAQKTFTKDVASIIYNKCSTCHRSGEIGPFTLTNYDDVANRSAIIKEVVSTGYMPPWKPDPEYNHFIGEYYLTDIEKQNIIDWVDQGAEYGNSTEEPSLPDFPEGSLLGEPDLVLEFDETHIHPGDNRDEYRYFVLPTGLTEDRVIKAIELRPGNAQIVHHALFFEDTEGLAAQYDAQTPEYGFIGFGGFGTDEVLNYDQYPGYVPGTKPIYFPDGLGQKMSAGSDLVIQMHYAPWPVNAEDKSKVNIFFADEETETIERLVDDRIMLPFDLPGGFFSFIIPPNQQKTFHGVWTLSSDRSLIGLSPHMHYLGTEWEVYLEEPDGSKVNLIKIEDWDFNWQGGYYFTRLIPALAGSKIHAIAKYNNTVNNPQNPSNPPVFVSWGEGTKDEMYYLPILSIPYQDGDEDVIFEDPTATLDLQNGSQNTVTDVYPNPVSQGLAAIDFSISRGTSLTINLLNIKGEVVRNIRQSEYFGIGNSKVLINVNSLTAGVYLVHITGDQINLTTKLIKE